MNNLMEAVRSGVLAMRAGSTDLEFWCLALIAVLVLIGS